MALLQIDGLIFVVQENVANNPVLFASGQLAAIAIIADLIFFKNIRA